MSQTVAGAIEQHQTTELGVVTTTLETFRAAEGTALTSVPFSPSSIALLDLEDVNRLNWEVSAPSDMQFRLERSNVPVSLEVSVFITWTASTAFAVSRPYVTVELQDMRNLNGTSVTFPDHWFVSSDSTSVTSSGILLVRTGTGRS